MANFNIDINDAAYLQHRTRFGNMVGFVRDRLRVYNRLEPDQQETWLAADPLMNDIIRFARKIQSGDDV